MGGWFVFFGSETVHADVLLEVRIIGEAAPAAGFREGGGCGLLLSGPVRTPRSASGVGPRPLLSPFCVGVRVYAFWRIFLAFRAGDRRSVSGSAAGPPAQPMMVGCAVVETGTRRAFSLFSLSARVAALQFGGARRRWSALSSPGFERGRRRATRQFEPAAFPVFRGRRGFGSLLVLRFWYAGRGGAAPN